MTAAINGQKETMDILINSIKIDDDTKNELEKLLNESKKPSRKSFCLIT